MLTIVSQSDRVTESGWNGGNEFSDHRFQRLAVKAQIGNQML